MKIYLYQRRVLRGWQQRGCSASVRRHGAAPAGRSRFQKVLDVPRAPISPSIALVVPWGKRAEERANTHMHEGCHEQVATQAFSYELRQMMGST